MYGFRGVVSFGVLLFTLVLLSDGPAEAKTRYLASQNWTDEDRDYFYYTSQGSQIMPYAWFRALERMADTRRFVGDGLRRYGYIPGKASRRNIDGLPVGFVIDKDRRIRHIYRSMLGLRKHVRSALATLKRIDT